MLKYNNYPGNHGEPVVKMSEGIRVSVKTFYQEDYSNPIGNEFMFAYHIKIENMQKYSVRLMSRRWYIFDSDGSYREVEGEGVVGMQPVIVPNSEYEYVSGCNLHSEFGSMHGVYRFQSLGTKQFFECSIPLFQMEAPFKLN